MRLLRSLIYAAWLYFMMAWVSLINLPETFQNGPRGVMKAQRAWAKAAVDSLWIIGARVVIEGRENIPPGPLLVACKHQSMLDVLVPGLFLDFAAFVFKAELLKEPILGWYINRAEMIPVEREAQAAALKSMLRAARKCKAAGRQIVIFPEGTRQEIGAPPDYKVGVVALYRDLDIPCVPVALNTGLIWKPKGVMRSPGVVTFKILPAIPPGLSREDFMHALETRIETASEALLPPQLRRSVSP